MRDHSTFYDRKELEFAEKILGSCGIIGVTFENLPDIGYDRWVYVGRWTAQSDSQLRKE